MQEPRVREEIPMQPLDGVQNVFPADISTDDEINLDQVQRPVVVAGVHPLAGRRPRVPPPRPPMPQIRPESAVAELNQFRRDYRVNNVVMGIR